MEKERIIWLCVFHQPMHGSQDVGFCRLAHWVLLVVGQKHHILALIPKMLIQIARHVLHVVDTSSQLSALAEIVDADQKRLPASSTCGILKRVTAWRTGSCADLLALAYAYFEYKPTKGLCLCRRWRRRCVISLIVSVLLNTGMGYTIL